MDNDIHNVVAESNETNNRCTIEFTARAPGAGNEPFVEY